MRYNRIFTELLGALFVLAALTLSVLALLVVRQELFT